MQEIEHLRSALDGDLLTPGTPGYDHAAKPAMARFNDVHPHAIVRAATVTDVTRTISWARDNGTVVVLRGGGHSFAGRSSTSEGLMLDLSRLDSITAAGNDRVIVGAGARLGQVYTALHQLRRALPLGCGLTVGIAGLTLGGGLGLVSRRHGLSCDALIGAQVVLADGRLVDCDSVREPDLYWALRGAGGGHVGVVTSLVFATIAEPQATPFEAHWTQDQAADVIEAWQSWAPDAPDELTANLTVSAQPGAPLRVVVSGAALCDEDATTALVSQLDDLAGAPGRLRIAETRTLARLKQSIAEPDPRQHNPDAYGRSELFTRVMPRSAVETLLDELITGTARGRRQLTFLALGGAYGRVPADATAYAHRTAKFSLDHLADDLDEWVDRSWSNAHPHGSGGVYPNFPDLRLSEPARAYHGGNLARLTAVKQHYDPAALFDSSNAA